MRPQLQRNLLTIGKAIGKMFQVLVVGFGLGFVSWFLFLGFVLFLQNLQKQ